MAVDDRPRTGSRVGAVSNLTRATVPAEVGLIRGLPAIVTFAGVTVVGLSDGGLFPSAWRLTVFAALLLTAAALIGRRRISIGAREWTVLAALAGFVAWNAASRLWSELPAESLVEAERNLLYLTCLAAVLFGLESGSVRGVLGGTLAGVTAVSAYGLGDYIVSRPPLDPFQGELLFEPFGYANAVGIYATLGILLAIGLALGAPSRPSRVAALAPLVVLVPTLYLTSSRGAWVALPVGLIATLFVSGRIRSPVVVVSLLAVGIALGVLLGSQQGQALSLLGQNRPQYWSVAWKDFEEHPVLGSGPATFGNFFLNHRSTDEYAHDAHNLYLESLAELGPLGLALVVVALGTPLLALTRRQDSLAAVAAGAYVAFVLHAGVDWDWEWPAVSLTGVLCGAALLVETRPARASAISALVRVGLLGAVAALSVFILDRIGSIRDLGGFT